MELGLLDSFAEGDELTINVPEEEKEEPLVSNYGKMMDEIILRTDQPGNNPLKNA